MTCSHLLVGSGQLFFKLPTAAKSRFRTFVPSMDNDVSFPPALLPVLPIEQLAASS
jgi:hypothetical protein